MLQSRQSAATSSTRCSCSRIDIAAIASEARATQLIVDLGRPSRCSLVAKAAIAYGLLNASLMVLKRMYHGRQLHLLGLFLAGRALLRLIARIDIGLNVQIADGRRRGQL